jgi:hypothetical protein
MLSGALVLIDCFCERGKDLKSCSVYSLNMFRKSRIWVWRSLFEVSLYASTILSLAAKRASSALLNLVLLVARFLEDGSEGAGVTVGVVVIDDEQADVVLAGLERNWSEEENFVLESRQLVLVGGWGHGLGEGVVGEEVGET